MAVFRCPDGDFTDRELIEGNSEQGQMSVALATFLANAKIGDTYDLGLESSSQIGASITRIE